MMETKSGLTAEQVEELILYIEREREDLNFKECSLIHAKKVLDKIRELQTPPKKYVDADVIHELIYKNFIDGTTPQFQMDILEQIFHWIGNAGKTLEELKDGE